MTAPNLRKTSVARFLSPLYNSLTARLTRETGPSVSRDTVTQLDSLFSYTTISSEDVEAYLNEIVESPTLGAANDRLRSKVPASSRRAPVRAVALYVLTRHFQPSTCVETGVRHGTSSAYLLEALRANGDGRLYSIDVPSPTLPDREQSGWTIPPEAQEYWSLTVGKSQDELYALLEDLGSIDLFYHDSYHKYPLMKWEFNTALEFMDDGLVTSDDINRNHAFLELCTKTDSTVNVTEPFEIGGKGVFGFAFVGDHKRTGIKMAEDR